MKQVCTIKLSIFVFWNDFVNASIKYVYTNTHGHFVSHCGFVCCGYIGWKPFWVLRPKAAATAMAIQIQRIFTKTNSTRTQYRMKSCVVSKTRCEWKEERKKRKQSPNTHSTKQTIRHTTKWIYEWMNECFLLLFTAMRRKGKEKKREDISPGTLKNHTHNCEIQTKANDLFWAFAVALLSSFFPAIPTFSLHCVLFHTLHTRLHSSIRNISAWDSSIAENIMLFDDNKDGNGNKNKSMNVKRTLSFWLLVSLW